jgi:hypothetical protein
MQRAGWKTAKRYTWLFIVAVVAMVGTSCSAAHADEAQAKSLFKAMSDYLAAQNAISFAFDSTLEVVTDQGQKLGLASSGTLTLNRPDKLRVTRTGGFANIEMAFDGKTLTLLDKNANMFAMTEETRTIDQLADVLLRKKYYTPAITFSEAAMRSVPAADLLMSDPYAELMPRVVDAKDLGSGVIRGVECHLAFRTDDVDWQIWIAQGDRPYPCRYVITSAMIRKSPQYTIDVWDWKTGAEVAAASFSLDVPKNAKKLEPGDVADELPAIFKVKKGWAPRCSRRAPSNRCFR